MVGFVAAVAVLALPNGVKVACWLQAASAASAANAADPTAQRAKFDATRQFE